MKPTIGRIVIYCQDGEEFAAIITLVHPGESGFVSLTVFPPRQNWRFIGDSAGAGGVPVPLEYVPLLGPSVSHRCWKWPERV